MHSEKNSTGIVDSGATDIYFASDAPVVNIDRVAPRVTVGKATGQTQQSAGMGKLALPHLPSEFTTKGHLMSGFRHTLIGVALLCDANCTVTFTRKSVIVRDKQGTEVITGWLMGY